MTFSLASLSIKSENAPVRIYLFEILPVFISSSSAPANINTNKIIKQHSGKSFKQSFRDILDLFNEEWKADTEARGPFMPLEQVTPKASYATQYSTPSGWETASSPCGKAISVPRNWCWYRTGKYAACVPLPPIPLPCTTTPGGTACSGRKTGITPAGAWPAHQLSVTMT